MKKRIPIIAPMVAGVITLFSPLAAYAHVKWFVDAEALEEVKPSLDLLTGNLAAVGIWIVVCLLLLGVAYWLDRVLPEPRAKWLQKLQSREDGLVHVLQVLIGVYIIVTAMVWKIILVPGFAVDSVYTVVLQYSAILAGVLFILNKLPRIAAAIVVVLVGLSAVGAEWESVLENIILLGAMAYIWIQHTPRGSALAEWKEYGVPLLRVTTGISLIVMAFTEKLFYPDLSLGFLAEHQWNFMQLVGFDSFSNELFVLSVGIVEALFGVIFLLGWITRMNTVAIACVFASSVTAMFLSFGKWEVEDLPVYAVAVIFLVYGSGKHWKLFGGNNATHKSE